MMPPRVAASRFAPVVLAVAVATLSNGRGSSASETLTQDESTALWLACRDATRGGRAAAQSCRERVLRELPLVARPDGVDRLSPRETLVLGANCSRDLALGPAALRRCQARELPALLAARTGGSAEGPGRDAAAPSPDQPAATAPTPEPLPPPQPSASGPPPAAPPLSAEPSEPTPAAEGAPDVQLGASKPTPLQPLPAPAPPRRATNTDVIPSGSSAGYWRPGGLVGAAVGAVLAAAVALRAGIFRLRALPSPPSPVAKPPVTEAPPAAGTRRSVARRPPARWYGPGEPARVADYVIADGMVYFGAFLPAFGVSDVVEPALVNPDLPVAAPSAVQRDLGTPYPPSYTAMTPEARGAYLRWLDDGKRDPAAPIVYVFLYLFGLERRLLTELPADDERDALAAEVRRLRAIYGDDDAFERSCNRLLEAADLVRALRTRGEVEGPILPDVLRPEQALTLVGKLQLARTIRAGKPLSFDEAMSLCLARHGWPVPPGRRDPYIEMMRERFGQRYPGGIRLPEPPAGTASLGRYEGMNPFVWTDLLRAGADGYLGDPSATDMTALADMVDEALAELASSEQAAPQALEQTAAELERRQDQLAAVTREVNVLRAPIGTPRAESERIDAERRGFELPVSELEAEPEQRRSESVDLDMSPMVTAAARPAAEAPPVWQIGPFRPSGLDGEPTRFGAQGDVEVVTPVLSNAGKAAPETGDVKDSGEGWLRDILEGEEPATTKLSDIVEHVLGVPSSDREAGAFNPGLVDSLASALGELGYGLEPDPLYVSGHFRADEPACLFRLAHVPADRSRRGTGYRQAAAVATLVAGIAAANDGRLGPAEGRLLSWIDETFALGEDERRRLRAHVRWLVASGAALERFGRLASDIPAEQRNRIAHFAASVAAADGQVTPAEREFLETAYDGLAVSREQLQRDLRELLGEPEPVLASETGSLATLPPAVPTRREPRYRADGIDPATLAQKRAETALVSSILQNLFADDEVIETRVRRRAAMSTRFPGLDADDAELLGRLLSKPAWSREAFDRLAGEVGILMPDGALEAINEWAFERYQEAIIEDGEPLVVRRELVTGPA